MHYYSLSQVAKVAVVAVLATVVVTSLVAVASIPSTVEFIDMTPEPINEVVALTQSILDSQEFNDEMKAIATARALYIISNKTQSRAVEYAEMAQMSHERSTEMSHAWLEAQQIIHVGSI